MDCTTNYKVLRVPTMYDIRGGDRDEAANSKSLTACIKTDRNPSRLEDTLKRIPLRSTQVDNLLSKMVMSY